MSVSIKSWIGNRRAIEIAPFGPRAMVAFYRGVTQYFHKQIAQPRAMVSLAMSNNGLVLSQACSV